MAEIGLVNITDIAGSGVFAEILERISFVSALLQAVGAIIILYIIFSIINIIIRKREVKLLREIKESLESIRKKLKN